MESFFATIEDDKVISSSHPLTGKKKVLITVFEEEDISLEGIMTLAATSGAFNFLFEEGEHEYKTEDLKVKYK